MTIKDVIGQIFKNLKINIKTISLVLDLQKIKLFFLYIFGLMVIFSVYNFGAKRADDQRLSKSESLKEVGNAKEFSELKEFVLEKLKSPYKEINYTIQNNDSIQKVLKKHNIESTEIKKIINELNQKKLSNIYSGRQLKMVVKQSNNSEYFKVVKLYFPLSNTSVVNIKKEKGVFIAEESQINLIRKEVVLKGEINNNLYSAAINSGIEPNVIIEFARIYGFEIDFQRDIRRGDNFEIFYEKYLDDKGKVRDTGKIIYASMIVNKREINLYNFKIKNEEGFYDINGKSIVKSLMKTPINGARLSSSFGMRKHPILGFNKMHRGTDFAAPKGTPIMASGSGTITRARWCGGGGNCVKIRHNSTYETIYAHMSKFARGIKEGRKVKQGQIIGYVGSTGMSTGPHLHYEVIVNGKKVNSQKLKLPSGKILKGEDRKNFEIERIKIDLRLADLKDRKF